MRVALCLLAGLALVGCGDTETAAEVTDPSVLTEDLEAEAKGIEDRANAAAREAEALAARELQEMQEAARAADITQADAEGESGNATAPDTATQ